MKKKFSSSNRRLKREAHDLAGEKNENSPPAPDSAPRDMVAQMKPWSAIGNTMRFGGISRARRNGRILCDPKNLGKGWIGFNFEKAFGKPVRVVNDAAMQALGSYRGRRMLFLGLGTGVGSALVWDNLAFPLELGDLPYRNGQYIIEDDLGKPGLARLGEKI